jgi:hypothetical protein
MRIMGLGLASLALAGVLTAYATESASAAAYTKDCRGTRQALQGGQCVNLSYDNPSRVRQECSGSSCYRSGRHKKKSGKISEPEK